MISSQIEDNDKSKQFASAEIPPRIRVQGQGQPKEFFVVYHPSRHIHSHFMIPRKRDSVTSQELLDTLIPGTGG